MKLGIIAGYSGRKFSISMDAIKHAENLGYDSIWTAEAYGSDAVTPAAWILAQTDRIKWAPLSCKCPHVHRPWLL